GQAAMVQAPAGGRAASYNPIQVFGVYAMYFYVTVVFTRILWYVFPSMHLPAILSAVMLVIVLMGGGIRHMLASPVGRWTFGFAMWVFAVVPFGIWRGGSFAKLQNQWFASVALLVIVLGLALSVKQIVTGIRVLFYGGIAT